MSVPIKLHLWFAIKTNYLLFNELEQRIITGVANTRLIAQNVSYNFTLFHMLPVSDPFQIKDDLGMEKPTKSLSVSSVKDTYCFIFHKIQIDFYSFFNKMKIRIVLKYNQYI